MKTPHLPRHPRVIVADDHEWILQILVKVVEQTLPQAEIIAVENGLKAWHAYENGGADFVVTNHAMPEVDGVTLIHRLREVAVKLPILMVSVKPAVKAEALSAGANWFLSKNQITAEMPALLLRHAARREDFPALDTDGGGSRTPPVADAGMMP